MKNKHNLFGMMMNLEDIDKKEDILYKRRALFNKYKKYYSKEEQDDYENVHLKNLEEYLFFMRKDLTEHIDILEKQYNADK